jgi:hypothetical protein
MRILALETDLEVLARRLVSNREQLLLTVRHSSFIFLLAVLRAGLVTALLTVVVVGVVSVGVPWLPTLGVALLVWLVVVGWSLLRKFIDWRYDVLFVTTEKIVQVDQTSILHSRIHQMNLENVASVAAETQFGNLLPFGRLHFELKEGTGKGLNLSYVAQAEAVAASISHIITDFQCRRANVDVAAMTTAPTT